MWKRAGVILLWVLATVGTASITLAAVSRVGGEVTEQAAVPIDSADLATATVPSSPVTATAPSTIPAGPSTTAVAEPLPGTTSTTTVESSAPSTTAPTTTSTSVAAETTTTTLASYLDTTGLIGGSVTVQVAGESVTLVSAIPAGSGWSVKVKEDGPDEVSVEFESETHESKYRAEVSGGVLVVSVEEEEEGGGGGGEDDD